MPMSAKADRRSDAGFSLVEVLCAVAIAAFAIVALSEATGGSLKGAQRLEMRQGAEVILRSILEDELAAGETAPAQRQGDSGPYRWQLDIAAADAEALPGQRMYRLTGTVAWGAGGTMSGSVLKLAP